jgi:arylsulfatase A-like enzyme
VYAAMIFNLDENIGRLLQALQETGKADNTLVVFTSDNGGESRVTSNAPLRAGKSTLYEGGIREPLLVKYPKMIKGGSVSNAPVITTDFYPTLIEMARARMDKTQIMDGRSFVDSLKNPNKARNETLYWYYPLAKPHFLGGRSAQAIRDGDYKLIEFFDNNTIELYNLKTDLSEQNDLSKEIPEKADELRRKLAAWRKQTVTIAPRFDEKPFAPNLNGE